MQSREFRAASVCCTVVVAYTAAVLGTGLVPLGEFVGLLGFYLGAAFGLWAFIGIPLILYCNRTRSREVGPLAALAGYAGTRWERDRMVSWLWPPLLFAFLLAPFNAFKQKVLPIAGYGYDPLLSQLDQKLFLGVAPWRVTHSVLGSPIATMIIDRLYHAWFAPMSLGLIACAWLSRDNFRLRSQYCFTYIGVWTLLGSVTAFAFPSAGPFFYAELVNPASPYEPLLARLHEQQLALGTHFAALTNRDLLLEARLAKGLVVGGGISALPSVHNGLAVLFALGAFQLSRAAGLVFAAYAFVIWIGSIHLGWHYAVDGLLAAAATGTLWILSGRLADYLDRTSAVESAELVPA